MIFFFTFVSVLVPSGLSPGLKSAEIPNLIMFKHYLTRKANHSNSVKTIMQVKKFFLRLCEKNFAFNFSL
jgi:hypothetical protein